MRRSVVLALRIAVVAALLMQVVSNRLLVPGDPDPTGIWFDLPFVVAATCCWQRSRHGDDQKAWRWLVFGLLSFVSGNLVTRFVLHNEGPNPSVSDGFWLGFYVCAYLGVLSFSRARFLRLPRTAWLDGAIGATGAAALAATFVFDPVLRVTRGDRWVVATNLAYPVADVLLVVLLVVGSHGLRRSDHPWWLLGVGLSLFLAGDIYYLYAEAAGTYVPGASPFELTWSAGVSVIGLSALTRPAPTVPPGPPTTLLRFFTPVVFTAASIGLLVWGQAHPLSVVAVSLTVAALALATIRLGLTMRDVHALAVSRAEARTDELTGLPNRRHIAELAAGALSRSAHDPVALIVLDLDRFKEINDSLGQVAGDLLLEHVSRRLGSAVGRLGTLGRLGGDEFAVLLPGHDADQALQVAAAMRGALLQSFELSGLPVSVQASMGVASAPAHGRTALQLLSRADIAMYQAKRSSTGLATYRVEQGNPSRERLQLLGELRHALATDQFALFYQPQIDLASGRLRGVEGLVRWVHPTRGVLPPSEFLRLVAETGHITELTQFALRRASADWADLRGEDSLPRMSVNVTAEDLSDGMFPAAVEALLGAAGFAPGALMLEVTEDDVLRDRAHGHAVLQHLRDLGCLVAIDDYGTGQASLSYLRDLPLDEIKLDQSFVRGAATDTHNAAIVRSTIELAHTLGLPIVAEGIEDHDTQNWLRTLGCDIGQGYHIARPMPADQLTRWLRRAFVTDRSGR